MTTSRYADGALLLPSPLLPGHVMDDLAVSLGRAGLPATVAAPDLAPGEGPPDLVDRWARQVRTGTVVVAHSNAGYLAPHVRRAAGTGGPVVFVDAALPPPSGHHRLAPPALRSWLGELAEDEGLLPPWTRWWPREDLEQALPTGQFDDLDGGHLHLLAEPDAVADAVLALVAQLSRGAGAPTPPPRQHTE